MNMDVCQNVSVSKPCQQEHSNSLDDLFSAQNMEVDVGMEWLSVFVEDCFSSPPSCLLVPAGVVQATTTSTNSKPSNTLKRPKQQEQERNESPLQNFAVPGKARSKRKRLSAPRGSNNGKDPLSMWSHHLNPENEALSSDPPLLKQAYWLADSELIVPKQEVMMTKEEVVEKNESFGDSELEGIGNGQSPMPRRCTHCLSQRTPQWRAGPLGPKTLCNACGVRYKSGRLLPEYRPAKSPTFVSYLHSNSHKKVMEMRMAVMSNEQ